MILFITCNVYWCQGEQGDCAILLCWVYFIWSLTNESRDNKDSDICYIFFFFNQSSLKHICVTVFFIPSLYPSKGLITVIRSWSLVKITWVTSNNGWLTIPRTSDFSLASVEITGRWIKVKLQKTPTKRSHRMFCILLKKVI